MSVWNSNRWCSITKSSSTELALYSHMNRENFRASLTNNIYALRYGSLLFFISIILFRQYFMSLCFCTFRHNNHRHKLHIHYTAHIYTKRTYIFDNLSGEWSTREALYSIPLVAFTLYGPGPGSMSSDLVDSMRLMVVIRTCIYIWNKQPCRLLFVRSFWN